MARQRINLKFIGISSAVLAAAAVSVVGYKKLSRHDDPEKLIQQGDALFQNAEYGGALSCYTRAVALEPKNGNGHLKVAKTAFLIDDAKLSFDEYAMAEAYMPDSKEAWAGTLQVIMRDLENSESTRMTEERQKDMLDEVGKAREAAAHLVKLDPDDVKFASASAIMDLRMWMLNLSIPLTEEERRMDPEKQPTQDKKVDDAILTLNQLLKKHSAYDQIPYWLARAKIHQAELLTLHPGSDVAAAQAPLFAEADAAFDEPIVANPDAARLYLGKADIVSMLMRKDGSAETQDGYKSQYKDCLEKVQKLVDLKSSREDYFIARIKYAIYLAFQGDPGRSEPIFKQLIKEFPERPQVSETYAGILKHDPSRIKDALAVLDGVPAVAPPILRTQSALERWDTAYAGIKLERANIQIDQLEYMPPGKAQQDVSDEVKKALAVAATRFDGKWQYLKALGRYQMSTGQYREAIETLQNARDKQAAGGQPPDPEVLTSLAKSYQLAGQPVEAVRVYTAALANSSVANNIGIRIKLTAQLLAINNLDDARRQLEWLKKRLPENDATLIQLELSALGPKPDPKEVADLIAKMPESNTPEKRAKAQVAFDKKDYPDALRVWQALAAETPADPAPVQQVIRTLYQSGQVDAAKAALADALKRFPDDAQLRAFDIGFHGNDAGALYDVQLAAIQKIPDPFLRESTWADLDQRFSRREEELEHRKNAADIQPDNIDANQTLFLRYLDARKYTEATAMIRHLSDINADQAHGRALQVQLYLAQRDAADAVTVANQVVKDAPQFWISYKLLGDAYKLAGQYDLATQNYISAWQKQPANMDVLNSLIYCETAQNRFDEARQYIAQARKMYPDDLKYLATQVLFECRHGNAEPLLPSLAAAVQKNPDDQSGYKLYGDALTATYQSHIDKGQLTEAQPFLDDLVSTLKEASRRWPDDLLFARNLADVLMMDKDPKGAEQVVVAASQRPRWKDQPAGQYLVGQFYSAEGKFDAAEPYLRKSVELAPTAVDAHVSLAEDLWNQDKKDDALRVLKPVIGRSIEAFGLYDQMLVKMQKGDQAESETNVALSANPKSPELNDLLIEVYTLNGRQEQAIALAKAVIRDDPSNIGAYLRLGKLLGTSPKPDFAGAISNVSVYVDARPDDVSAREVLGAFLKANNDRDKATKQFQIAAQLAPQDRRIRLQLLDCYLNSTPPRVSEAETLVNDLLGMEQFKHDPDFLRAAAVMWAQNGDNTKAVTAIRDAVKQMDDPKYKDSVTRSAVLGDYLRVLLLTKNYGPLVDEADKLTADPKAGWGVYSYRARGKDSAGDKAGALDDFKISLDKAGVDPNQTAPIAAGMAVKEQLGLAGAVDLIKPRSENSLLWKLVMVYLYQDAKDYNDALVFGEDAMKHLSELEPGTQRNLIRTVANLAAIASPPRYDRAIELFRKVLANTPDDTASMNDLASVLLDSPDHANYPEALQLSTKATELSEKQGVFNPRMYDTKGWAMVLNGRVDEGLDVLHKACDEANFPDAHYHLGRAYLLIKHPEDAVREFTNASNDIAAAKQNGDTFDSTLPDKIIAGQVDAKKMTDDVAKQGQNPQVP
jgi:tetratricopeptide (TPR) repeat protein